MPSVAIGLNPGFEFFMVKIRPADLFPIDIGLALQGALRWWPPDASGRGALGLTAGSLVTAHFGFGTTSSPGALLDRLDFHSAFGLEYQLSALFGDWSGSTPPASGLSFAAYGGITYFLSDTVAAQLRASYHAGGSSIGLGAVLKLGSAETTNLAPAGGSRTSVAEAGDASRLTPSTPPKSSATLDGSPGTIRPGDIVGAEFAYLNFTSLYQTGLGYLGFEIDDESFGEGEAVRWRIRFLSDDAADELMYTRALLRINSDGSKWWRTEFFWDGRALPFDYLVDRADGLAELVYYDRATNQVTRYQPQDPDTWQSGVRAAAATRELETLSGQIEHVRVEAGSFDSRRKTLSHEGAISTVWLSDGVPGRLIRFTLARDGETVIEGELVGTADGFVSPWGSPW